ncbi:HU family DNA-binding protein [Spiroplasma endosymbiont of Crioceris asparagi]|uniref:HU family DNA-binding protein n=1 Tax=Spiroplasma endosymbiont of Crioceris asparagi TaxID=3066286 RepID=UPI0030D2CD33
MAKKTKPMQGLVSDGIAPKAKSGSFAERPKILEEFNQKQQRIIQSRQMGAIKKGEASRDSLPEGVKKSIENKERISEVINMAGENDVDSIKERYAIDRTPLTRAKAKKVRDERLIKFGTSEDSRMKRIYDDNFGVSIKKLEIAERAARAMGVEDHKLISKIINLLFAEIKLALINGNEVNIAGFGSFKITVIKAHQSVNLATGTEIYIPTTSVVKFKASKNLKDALEK